MKDTLSIDSLYQAYKRARKGKSKRRDVISWEKNLAENMQCLYTDILSGTYDIGPTKRYIIHDPVRREIVVIPFRDRIVQHLIYALLLPLFEPQWLYDNYANRIGKGTLFGVKRIDTMMRSCSKQYTTDAWILKCDIQSCFMSIDRRKVRELLSKRLFTMNISDKALLLFLTSKVLFHDYVTGWMDHSKAFERSKLPFHKSILSCGAYHGLPLGNLTSHLFASILLHELDMFIKHTLSIRYYGRYVDDFVLFHHDKHYLKHCLGSIKDFLITIGLSIHPNKIYLQHYSKGVKFLGVMVLPYRRYVGKRTVYNWKEKIDNAKYASYKTIESLFGSYEGLATHHSSFRIMNKMKERMRATSS